MSRTVVKALSRVVAHRTSRRGFLARSAFGATALAVAPVAFATRPISAQAAICLCADSSCGCGDLCCDGFSDFCCKLTGENLCPPNTVVAGWWKADGTGFCDVGDSPRPRYYLDCNHLCDDGCGCNWAGVCSSSCTTADCRCLEGCDSRSVDCTRFRYGQCNQDIACVGPIACRIVTCVPPWLWDGSCDETPATDNSTGFHDRPCLHDGFTDLAPNAYYVEAVEWAYKQGITTGYSSDIFGPQEPVLRWHAAAFLWRYQGEPEPLVSAHFKDIPGYWYAPAVNWMVEAGITTGTEDRLFEPDAPVTRGQAVTFLWGMRGRPTPELSAPPPFGGADYFPFDDVDV
ncbi:MAG: S-layer homology domain-containing protein, partial [Acidimicrobiaceae bacterium]|nr:S-layer homology domain-containing protein [Acidimicrobiaceae bacterium]